MYEGKLRSQKGNVYLPGIGRYTKVGFEPSVQNILAIISNTIGSDPSQKIAEAIRISRTTGHHIVNVRISEDGDGPITDGGIFNNYLEPMGILFH